VNNSDCAKPYFVHYVGWKSRWDEWISGDAVVGLADDTATRRTSRRLLKVEVLSETLLFASFDAICQCYFCCITLSSSFQ